MSLDPISAALDIGGKLIDRLWPDPAQASAAKLQLLQMQQSGELAKLTADTDLAKAQMAVNQVEAANKSVFIAGWRPAIGWVCALSLGYQYVVRPLAGNIAAAAGHPLPMLTIDDGMWQLIFAMLGLGAMRTAEKLNGASSGH